MERDILSGRFTIQAISAFLRGAFQDNRNQQYFLQNPNVSVNRILVLAGPGRFLVYSKVKPGDHSSEETQECRSRNGTISGWLDWCKGEAGHYSGSATSL